MALRSQGGRESSALMWEAVKEGRQHCPGVRGVRSLAGRTDVAETTRKLFKVDKERYDRQFTGWPRHACLQN